MSIFCNVFRAITCNSLSLGSDNPWEDMEDKLRRHGQDHVLTPPPPEERKAAFLAQLQSLDLEGIPRMLKTSLAGAEERDIKREPLPEVVSQDKMPAEEVKQLHERGLTMIARGEVAALLLAGGQGTRLGTSAPKGCYDIGLPSGKSLYQYHAEKILKVRRLAAAHCAKDESSVRLRLLVMTSPATDAETRSFFATHDHFGLGADGVSFFEQGMLPCLTPEGQLMLDAPGNLAMAPNGNGGVYVSLRDSGTLAQLEREGVTSIFQFGVDNVLCHVADPVFLGFCASRDADCAAKTVPKRDAHEPVGVVALADGKPAVVEYSEISKEMAEATDPTSGQLLYGASHICVNFFALAFLRDFCERRLTTLPLHVAKKKIPYVNAHGDRITPTSNNGIKLELFIFDTFPHAKRMAALMVPRADEFAPVKNAPGAASDSPDTARALIYELSLRRLLAAGGKIKEVKGGSSGLLEMMGINKPDASNAGARPPSAAPVVEISPLLSYQGEGLEASVKGKVFTPPVHLS